MATIYDYEDMKKAMNETKNTDRPWLCWIKQISISYSKPLDRWIATFPNDVTIIFEDIRYGSNMIYFENGGLDIGFITHAGLLV